MSVWQSIDTVSNSLQQELNKQLYLSCTCSKQQGTQSMSWVFIRRGHITLSLVYSYWKFLKFALILATWLNSSVFCLSGFVVRMYYRLENYNTKQTAEKASFSNAWLQIKLSALICRMKRGRRIRLTCFSFRYSIQGKYLDFQIGVFGIVALEFVT